VFYKRRGNTHQQVETFKYFRVIFTSDGNRKKYIEIRLLKQMQICVRFFAPWWRNGSFHRQQTFQFLNQSLFRSSPVVMNPGADPASEVGGRFQ